MPSYAAEFNGLQVFSKNDIANHTVTNTGMGRVFLVPEAGASIKGSRIKPSGEKGKVERWL